MGKIIYKIPRNHLLILIGLPIFLIFKNSIDKYLFEVISKFIEKNADLEILSFVILPSFLIASVCYFCLKIEKNYTPTFSSYIVNGSLIILYLLGYRYNGHWIFYDASQHYLPGIKYGDLIFFPTLIWVSIFVKQKNITISKNEKLPKFFEDSYQEFGSKDLLSRKDIADKIAGHIRGTAPSKAFAIGIVGDWGSGKSVFVGFLKDELKKNGEIIIEFKPWKYRKDTELISAFFSQMEKEISKYNPKLGRNIIQYAEGLKDISDNWVAKTVFSVMDIVGKKTEKDLSRYISESLKELDRKIIIVIDDVDRLKPKEIFEVLKIIRSSFDFPNTFFLVAYDTEYLDLGVKVATKAEQTKRYAEKIFQLEFNLPSYRKSILINELKIKLLQDIIDPEQIILIETAINKLAQGEAVPHPIFGQETNWLEDLLETLRDVIRVANELKLSFSCIPPEEFNLSELILLGILKVKYPVVHRLIKEKVIIQEAFGLNQNDYTTPHIEFQDEKFSKTKPNELGLRNEPEKDKVKNLLMHLFKKEKPLDRDVNNPGNYDLYFGYTLFGKISFKEYKHAKSQGISAFKSYIRNEVNKGNSNNLTQIFLELNSFSDRVDFEITIAGELELARLVNGLVTTDLYTKINKIRSIAERYYGWDEKDTATKKSALDAYKQFLIKILVTEAEFPFAQESTALNGFLSLFIKDVGYVGFLEGIFNKEEIQKMLLELFVKRLSHKETIINTELFRLYYQNQESIDPKTSLITLTSESSKLLMEFIRSSPSNELDYLAILPRQIYYPPSEGEEVSYTLEPFWKQYFSTWDKLKEFIVNTAKRDAKAKYLESKLDEFESSGFKEFKAPQNTMKKLGFKHY